MLSAITKYHIFRILIMQKSVANMDNSAGHFSLLLLHYIKTNFKTECSRGRTLMALNNFDEFIDKTDYLQTRLL